MVDVVVFKVGQVWLTSLPRLQRQELQGGQSCSIYPIRKSLPSL